MKKILNILLISSSSLLLACEGFLDPKPDQGLLVPNTLDDVQILMDNNVVFNRQATLVNVSADDFWTTSEAYQGMSVVEQGAYLWQEDPYQGSGIWDWEIAYNQVFYANIALKTLDEYTGSNKQWAEELRGMALFYKSYAYYQLLQQFAPPFQRDGGNSDLPGIILREQADINNSPQRSSVEECYTALLRDMEVAVGILPIGTEFKTRPTRAAGYGLLAKVYLLMFEYEKAAQASQAALDLYSDRMDLNELNVQNLRPFERFGPETIFYSVLHSSAFSRGTQTYVDTVLLNSYEPGDLRLEAYFNARPGGYFNMTGHHTGSTIVFGGLTVGELQLIAAEGFARSGNSDLALSYLNQLLENRYLSEIWMPLEGLDEKELLNRVLLERRKELVGRGIRWSDLRRLNQEPDFEKIIIREIDGQEFSLQPNSNRYVFPIPDNEIIRSGVEQNPR
ncbi:RagB/SusD family nutrient uptake outer membrane protein [Algoriphagus yeomjeoni]|uniref:RagB/SusD family nutrient uptake outer membrane protein n=1 Tax=Algoriphagus yeomjeoni TaxID=291403 RepID=UPI003CE5A840